MIRAAFESDEEFTRVLSRVIKDDLHMTAAEFSERAGIPQSTLYKILSGHREPNVTTLRSIIRLIRSVESENKGDFIAVIATRPVLDNIVEKKMKVGDQLVTIREYSANSVEDAIVAAIKAERDGARALVCAPIVSSTVEKILRIPVATIMPRNSLLAAIELAARKMG